MGEIVLKCISIILLTAFSSFLVYSGDAGLAVLSEIVGLAIIFDVPDAILEIF